MKNVKNVFVLALLLPVFFSCKKNNDDCPSPNDSTIVSYDNYSQLKVGNYWIYQIFNLDSSGNAVATNAYDSSWIDRDTVTNGKTYYFRRSVNTLSTTDGWFRDSLHYITTISGEINFSYQDFNTVFKSYYLNANPFDTIAFVTVKMSDPNFIKNTPLGNYVTQNFKTNYDMFPNWSSAGTPRSINVRYAKNVGIVSETLLFFASTPTYQERRLVRYYVH